MSVFLFFTAFIVGVGVLVSFIKGLIDYFSDRPYRKWWKRSLVLFAVTCVLTLLASMIEPELGLGTGFVFIWFYISMMMFAVLLVFAIKKVRKDSTEGYLKRIGIIFAAGSAALFIGAASTDPIEDPEREAENVIASSEEERTEEESTEEEATEEPTEEASSEEETEETTREETEESTEEPTEESTEEKVAEEASTEEIAEEEPSEEKVYEPGTLDRIPVTVASYTDGDTTRFHYDGRNEPFRYLLIDTPETNHPRVGEQPFGQEASDRTKELLSSAGTIEVEFDVGPRQDHYDRYLAYVYADGEMVNEILVREGLAQVNYIEPPNTRHLERLREAQRLAQAEEIGIWSLPHPFDSDVYQEPSESGSSNGGSQSSEPSDSTNEPAQTTENFQNCTELKEVYPDGVDSNHPAYQSKMDRDNDGYACE